MTTYLAAQRWNDGPTSQSLWGGLGDGYFLLITAAGAPRVTTLRLRHYDDPATDVDTETLGTYPDDFYNIAPARDGEVWYTRANFPTTYQQLTKITRSGATLVKTEVGSSIAATAFWSRARRTFDGAAFYYTLSSDSQVNYARSTTDASLLYSWTKNAGAGHDFYVAVPMDSSRVLGICFTHGNWELWNAATDTLLDSIASLDSRWDGYTGSWTAVGVDRAFYAWQPDLDVNPARLDMGVVTTTGDSLAVEWSSNGYGTNWQMVDEYERVYAAVSSVGSQAVVHARDEFYTVDPAVSLYVVDTDTGQVSASAPSTLAACGVASWAVESHSLSWGSPTRLIVDMSNPPGSDPGLVGWTVTVEPPSQSYRPIGGNPRLRQRQTPYIT